MSSFQVPHLAHFHSLDHLICDHYSRKVLKSGSRKVVREICFEKSGSRKVVDQKKGGVILNPPFFRLDKNGWPEKKSEFVEPLFYTFLKKWLQIKCSIGCLKKQTSFKKTEFVCWMSCFSVAKAKHSKKQKNNLRLSKKFLGFF